MTTTTTKSSRSSRRSSRSATSFSDFFTRKKTGREIAKKNGCDKFIATLSKKNEERAKAKEEEQRTRILEMAKREEAKAAEKKAAKEARLLKQKCRAELELLLKDNTELFDLCEDLVIAASEIGRCTEAIKGNVRYLAEKVVKEVAKNKKWSSLKAFRDFVKAEAEQQIFLLRTEIESEAKAKAKAEAKAKAKAKAPRAEKKPLPIKGVVEKVTTARPRCFGKKERMALLNAICNIVCDDRQRFNAKEVEEVKTLCIEKAQSNKKSWMIPTKELVQHVLFAYKNNRAKKAAIAAARKALRVKPATKATNANNNQEHTKASKGFGSILPIVAEGRLEIFKS